MCGICGIISWHGPPVADLARVERMLSLIRHRGPDALGIYGDDAAVLGHARLSVVDPAGGAQPMSNEDESLWIVFNGEVYNHLELGEDLRRRGYRLATRCDTEVVLRMYEAHGADCLRHLNGQFALAIWDRRRRVLFAARDRLGVRPLYYATVGGALAFASEVKSLLQVPGVPASLDPLGLDQAFTFWGTVAPRTVFEGIRQLPAGHFLRADDEGVRVERWWSLDFPDAREARPLARGGEQAWVEGLRDELVRATRLRMRADVPVAGYLSGGLDSSLIAAMVARHTGSALRTFSIGFEDRACDESAFQDAMVRHLGSQHAHVQVRSDDVARQLPEVVWHAETPILRLAPVPLHALSALVRDSGIKVVLTGEGADEVLGGYDLFKEARLRRLLARRPRSRRLSALLETLYPDVRMVRGGHAGGWQRFFARGAERTDDPCYSHALRWANTAFLKRFLSARVRDGIGTVDCAAEFARTLPERFPFWSPLAQAQYVEIATFMTSYLLSAQGDRVAMAHGVEGRFPFLDHRLVAFAAGMPDRCKLRGMEEKHALREVARDYLPEAVWQRRKQPYHAPDHDAFRSEEARSMVHDLLCPRAIAEGGWLDPTAVAALLHKRERLGGAAGSAREDMALVGLLSVQLLHRLFVAARPTPEPLDPRALRLCGPVARARGVPIPAWRRYCP